MAYYAEMLWNAKDGEWSTNASHKKNWCCCYMYISEIVSERQQTEEVRGKYTS